MASSSNWEKLSLKKSTTGPTAKRLLADGRYLLSGSPRQGGLASVYRAYDAQAEMHVALKVFRAASGADEVIQESFRREVQALSDLRHPNVVAILDSGFDPASAEHFIAMEWVDRDLEGLRKASSFTSWSDFYPSIGRQVLEALAFAHTRATVHRDVKPSNILVTDDGVAKVCDFGISKIRTFLEPGITLAQYASLPFAPPEPDDGTYSYSRDVFGFGAVCVAALTSSTLATYEDLLRALDEIPLEERIRQLLRQCLSLREPSQRPQNAALLLSEFERTAPVVKAARGAILVSRTKRVSDIIQADLALAAPSAVDRFIESDLADCLCHHQAPEPNKPASGQPAIRLLGQRYGYIAVTEDPDRNKLRLVTALDIPESEMDRDRERAYDARLTFAISGVPPQESAANLSMLHQELYEFAATQKVLQLEQRKQAIYRTWLDLLSAKTELERQRKHKVGYDGFEPSGNAIRFTLSDGSDPSLLDEEDVCIEAPNGSFVGSVVSASDDSIVVMPSAYNRVDTAALPTAGWLTVDTSKADAALDKERAAVDAVRYGRSVNPALGDYIVDPARTPIPAHADVDFIQTAIDDDKKQAVRVALGQPPLMLVQGPPGTGKTTFITELVLQTLRKDPHSRILLTSQTHVALDNSLERIASVSGGTIQAVRIGRPDDERIAETTKHLLVDNKLPVLRKQAIATGRQFLEEWALSNGVDLTSTRMALALERHARLRERLDAVEKQIASLRPLLTEKRTTLDAEVREEYDETLAGSMKEQEDLRRDIKESLADLRKHETDKDALTHFAECSADELRSWAGTYTAAKPAGAQLRKLLLAHSDWEARFGRSREFRAALIASSQVVAGTCLGVMSVPGRKDITYDLCIVDEASIATPTQVLVPMARARRTVLVGDSKQLSPFQDPDLASSGLLRRFQLSTDSQRATLFNHLNEGLPEGAKRALTTQHRMLPAIGDLISECFYDRALQSVKRDPKAHFARLMKQPVTWLSTSRHHQRTSRAVETSQTNNLEVQLIVRLLNKWDFSIRHSGDKGKQFSVAVLTGYGAQKKLLRAAIDTRAHEWVAFSKIFVNVIDAFQGREADVLVFSVTRSDARGLGFLREMERINVALSRGKEVLVIVGDHVFCQEAEHRNNPLKTVLDYMRGHPETCVIEDAAE